MQNEIPVIKGKKIASETYDKLFYGIQDDAEYKLQIGHRVVDTEKLQNTAKKFGVDARHAVFRWGMVSEGDINNRPWIGYLLTPNITMSGGALAMDHFDPNDISGFTEPMTVTGKMLKIFLKEAVNISKELHYTLIGANCFTPLISGLMKIREKMANDLKDWKEHYENMKDLLKDEQKLQMLAKIEKYQKDIKNMDFCASLMAETNNGFGMATTTNDKILEMISGVLLTAFNPYLGVPVVATQLFTFIRGLREQYDKDMALGVIPSQQERNDMAGAATTWQSVKTNTVLKQKEMPKAIMPDPSTIENQPSGVLSKTTKDKAAAQKWHKHHDAEVEDTDTADTDADTDDEAKHNKL